MPGGVDNPMLSRGLLLVVALVLCGGVGVVDNRPADAAVFNVVVAPCPCGRFGVERPNIGASAIYPIALVARVYNVRNPYLAEICLPVALLRDPFLLRLDGF